MKKFTKKWEKRKKEKTFKVKLKMFKVFPFFGIYQIALDIKILLFI